MAVVEKQKSKICHLSSTHYGKKKDNYIASDMAKILLVRRQKCSQWQVCISDIAKFGLLHLQKFYSFCHGKIF